MKKQNKNPLDNIEWLKQTKAHAQAEETYVKEVNELLLKIINIQHTHLQYVHKKLDIEIIKKFNPDLNPDPKLK